MEVCVAADKKAGTQVSLLGEKYLDFGSGSHYLVRL